MSAAHVRPVFAAILNSFTALPQQAENAALQAYRQALARFDWQFEFSADHAVWGNGINALARLRRIQRDLDPDGSIWMSEPGAQQHGAPGPIVVQEAT